MTEKAPEPLRLTMHRLRVPLSREVGDCTCSYSSLGAVAVRIEAADGAIGWGYGDVCDEGVFDEPAYFIEPLPSAEMLAEQVRAGTVAVCAAGTSAAPGIASFVSTALDLALLDLCAVRASRSLAELTFGHERDSVRAYGSTVDFPLADSEFVSAIAHVLTTGVDLIKVKVGGGVERDVHRLRLAREAVPEGVALAVDANRRWSLEQCADVLAALRGDGIEIAYVEDPFPVDDMVNPRRLTERHDIPVVGHDYVFEPADLDAWVRGARAGVARVAGGDLQRARQALALLPSSLPIHVCNSIADVGLNVALGSSRVTRIEYSGLGWERLLRRRMEVRDGLARFVGPADAGLSPELDVLDGWITEEPAQIDALAPVPFIVEGIAAFG